MVLLRPLNKLRNLYARGWYEEKNYCRIFRGASYQYGNNIVHSVTIEVTGDALKPLLHLSQSRSIKTVNTDEIIIGVLHLWDGTHES